MAISRQDRRRLKREIEKENDSMPEHLTEIKDALDLINAPNGLIAAYRSKHFIAQIYSTRNPEITRISVCRTAGKVNQSAKVIYEQNITWDELQRIKRECGFGDLDAVEVYPADIDVVNVANMRHLWVFKEPLDFIWRKKS